MKQQNDLNKKIIKLSSLLIFTLLNLNILIYAQPWDPVLLDPGHGGTDGGNPGNCGIIEKTFNLDISNEVYDLIDFDFSCPWFAYTTRHTDMTIEDYNDRWRMANNTTTDWDDSHGIAIPDDGVLLFMSIHANASQYHTLQGTEVFYYESSDDRARRSKNVSVLNLQYYLDRTRPVFSGASSLGIKDDTQSHLGVIGVLKWTTMPAVLVETEFIDNPNNCSYFDQTYQNLGAEGIKEAICWTRASETDYVNLEMTGNFSSGLYVVETEETFVARNTTPRQAINYYVENFGTDLYLETFSLSVIDDFVRVVARSGGYISIGGAAILIIGEAGEIIPGFGSILMDKGGNISFLGPGACIGINEGGTYILDKNVSRTFYNNGIFAIFEENATVQLNKGSELIIDESGVLLIQANPTFIFQLPQPKIKIFGKVIIADDVNLIFPAGADITIYPGAEFVMGDNSSITIEGNFQAIGDPSNKITFNRSGTSGTWGSIIFDGSSSSSSVINNARIEYGSGIQCLNGADITIENSIIENCTNGIYIYNSEPSILYNEIKYQIQNGIYGEAPGKEPLIKSNEITRTSSQNFQGIWFTNYTRPYITNNDVSGFHHAVYLGGGSYTYLTNNGVTSSPNNRFINSLNGLNTGWGSTTIAGRLSYGGQGGYNSIYDNVYWDVKTYNNSIVYAELNYWGGGAAHGYVDGTSELYTTPYLVSDPWSPSSAPISNQGDVDELADFDHKSDSNPMSNPNSDLGDLLTGINLEREGRINEAIIHYEQMVDRNVFVRPALTSLASIANRYDRNDLFNYFEQLVTDRAELKAILLRLLAAMHLNGGNYNKTLNIYDEIILEYGESYEGVSARLDKLFAVLNYGKNILIASNLFMELESLRITDEELLTRLEFANYLLNGSTALKKGTESLSNGNNDNERPKKFALYNNYPNPFNPTTTIDYSIKLDGLVSLKVYDILGKEVVSLVNENQVAGNYSVQFDASNLPSGIYIYKLTSGQFTSSKKLILLK